VGLPALLVLRVGLASGSRLRDHRFQILAIGWPLLLASTGIAVVLCSLLAVAVSSRKLRGGLTRPSSERTRISRFAAAPLILTAVVFAVAGGTGDPSGNLRLLGLIGAVAGTPPSVPGILRVVGAALGGSTSTTRALVGRSLKSDPKRAARPFMELATLLVVVFSISGLYAFSKAISIV